MSQKKPQLTFQTPQQSACTTTHMVLPSHTNSLGTLFGGTLTSWIDIAAAISAGKHCRSVVVTASIDDLHFIAPIRLGHIVTIKAMVNRAFRTSMEVGVRVESEDQKTGQCSHNLSAYLTFVALDEKGKPIPVPEIRPETPEEQQRYDEAKRRKDHRLKLAAELREHRERARKN